MTDGRDRELEVKLRRSLAGRGSPTDVREREVATAWLLAHADLAYPAVLARAEAVPADPAAVELLGRFRRAESTPALLRAFRAGGSARRAAAAALGTSPDPAAEAALRDAVERGGHDERVAGLAGLGASGDAHHCGVISEHLRDPDAEVRWVALHAGGRLGCLPKSELERVAREDPDASVRALAAELVAR